MKLLLDTNVFIWLVSEVPKVTPKALDACEDSANEILLSTASVWEMQIKHQAGRLDLEMPLRDLVAEQRRTRNLQILPINLDHIYELAELEPHHRDPFDRILVCQARVEDAQLVTSDGDIAKYAVNVLW